MAIELFERDKSRRRTINKEGEAELLFWAKGSDDDQAIVDHVLDNAPDEWADLLTRQQERDGTAHHA